MAAAQGVSSITVFQIWRAHRLQPHRVETFKLSKDPQFVDKVRDVVGLYLNPPDQAIVLSVDEKSQIQALDRTQPILPLRPGVPERQTHDYQRHGTTTLFAALNVLTGKVIGACKPRHRHGEFLEFLQQIDRSVPANKEVHLILDNYGTHSHAKVREWLEERPRYHLAFHANRGILVELGGTLLFGNHRTTNPTRDFPQRAGIDPGYPRLRSRPEQEAQAFCLGCHRFPNSQQGEALFRQFKNSTLVLLCYKLSNLV